MEPFLKSAASGNVDQLLNNIKSVQDINVRDRSGWTALMLAARNGHFNVTKELINRGCNAGIVNQSGQTAQDIAEFWQHEKIVKLLSSITDNTTQQPQLSNFLCNSPLDRSAQKRTDEKWIEKAMKHPDSTYIVFSNLSPLVYKNEDKTENEFKLSRFNSESILKLTSPEAHSIFLGIEQPAPHTAEPESGWFAVETHLPSSEITTICPSTTIKPCPYIFRDLPRSEAAVAGMARSVLVWHQRSAFCSVCGHSSTLSHAGFKRTCSNEQCLSNKSVFNTCYPRVDPSVIMAISTPTNHHILLARNHNHPTLLWSVLAGFMEPGESIEEACRREVMEETSVKVGEVTYHSSQPWPMPGSLMVGCAGKALSEKIVIDESELSEARWFSREEVDQMLLNQHPEGYIIPPKQTISNKLILNWLSKQD